VRASRTRPGDPAGLHRSAGMMRRDGRLVYAPNFNRRRARTWVPCSGRRWRARWCSVRTTPTARPCANTNGAPTRHRRLRDGDPGHGIGGGVIADGKLIRATAASPVKSDTWSWSREGRLSLRESRLLGAYASAAASTASPAKRRSKVVSRRSSPNAATPRGSRRGRHGRRRTELG